MKFNTSKIDISLLLSVVLVVAGCVVCNVKADEDVEMSAEIAIDTAVVNSVENNDSVDIVEADEAIAIDEALPVSVETHAEANLQHPHHATNAFDDGIVCPIEQEENSFVVQIPSPTDCSVFYKCNRGVPNMIKCPDGLHYNVRLQACDFPSRANCHLASMI